MKKNSHSLLPPLDAALPKGVRYFYGEQVIRRRAITEEIMKVFQGWSYGEIVLPIFDYHHLFALGIGTTTANHTYRFIDPDGELLALRPDLTSMVARTVATRFAAIPRPIRLCYSGEVFRYREAHEQRPHDLYQLGLEHIGNDRQEADLEILLIAIEALVTIGIPDFRINISHVGFFNGLAEYLNLAPQEAKQFSEIIDHKNSERLQKFLTNYLSEKEIAILIELVTEAGHGEILQQAERLAFNDTMQAAVTDLIGILSLATALEIEDYLSFDCGEVQGLDYYTGMTFKIYGNGAGTAIGSGGRYDRLLENFGNNEPAVGFQLSLDWLEKIAHPSLSESSPPVEIMASQDLTAIFKRARQQRETGQAIKITAHLPEN